MSDANKKQVLQYLVNFQETLCAGLQAEDPSVQIQEDEWQRPGGGGGRTRALSQGAIFEKGGVNFSHVMGKNLPPSATLSRPELVGAAFEAMGVSLVLHSLNPYVPAVHLNLRFFIAELVDKPAVWWFGGGYDLTPYYGFIEDCQHWHRQAKRACAPFGAELYPRYKKWCDDYFYLKHRQEARGVGGLFFDDVNEHGFSQSFAFIQSVGASFLPAYLPIVQKRQALPYGALEKEFQCFRRARYVEFNLVYDRGTLFGLQSGGRTESILVSMPPQASWAYDWQVKPGSAEAKLSNYLQPQDWLAEEVV